MKAGGRQTSQTSQGSRASTTASYAAVAHQGHTPHSHPPNSTGRDTRQAGRGSYYQGRPQANHVTGGYDTADGSFHRQRTPDSQGIGRGRGWRAERGSPVTSSVGARSRKGSDRTEVGGAYGKREV